MGQNNSGFQEVFEIGCIKCRRGRSITCGGAYGEDVLNIRLLCNIIDIAQGTGHAPVLERGAWVQPIVFKIKVHAHQFLQPGIGLDHRSMSFPKVDNPIQGNDRCNKFIVAKDPVQRLLVQHPSVIKDFPPFFATGLFEPVEVIVLKQEHLSTFRAGVQEPLNAEFLFTTQTPVQHVSLRPGYQIGSHPFRELVNFHGNILCGRFSHNHTYHFQRCQRVFATSIHAVFSGCPLPAHPPPRHR